MNLATQQNLTRARRGNCDFVSINNTPYKFVVISFLVWRVKASAVEKAFEPSTFVPFIFATSLNHFSIQKTGKDCFWLIELKMIRRVRPARLFGSKTSVTCLSMEVVLVRCRHASQKTVSRIGEKKRNFSENRKPSGNLIKKVRSSRAFWTSFAAGHGISSFLYNATLSDRKSHKNKNKKGCGPKSRRKSERKK